MIDFSRTYGQEPNDAGNELDPLAASLDMKSTFDVAAERQVIDLLSVADSRLAKALLALLESDDFTDDACQASYLACRANHERSQPDSAAEFTERQGAGEAVSAVIRCRLRREVEQIAIPLSAAAYSDGDLPSAMLIAVEGLNKQLRRWREFLRRFPQASGGIN